MRVRTSNLFIFNFSYLMNSFLIKSGLFFFTLLCMVIVLFFYLGHKNSSLMENYRVDATVSSVFIGDSHVQSAVDDKRFRSSLNLAQHSEAPIFSYFKLKFLLQSNPSIKEVYLGFGYHSISAYFDDYTFGEYSENISSRYFFIVPFEIQKEILARNKQAIPMIIHNSGVKGWDNLFAEKRELSFVGKYENGYKKTAVAKKSVNKRICQQFFESDTLRGFSAVNIEYFYKIIELCTSRKIKLLVINTPLNSYYKSRIPAKFTSAYDSIVSRGKVELINFDDLILTDSCFIPDGDHVSEKGAELTTDKIMRFVHKTTKD